MAMYGFMTFLFWNGFGSSWPKVKSFFEAIRNNEAASLGIGSAGFCVSLLSQPLS